VKIGKSGRPRVPLVLGDRNPGNKASGFSGPEARKRSALGAAATGLKEALGYPSVDGPPLAGLSRRKPRYCGCSFRREFPPVVCYHESLCSPSHTFLRYRAFRLSTVDFRLAQERGEFQIRLVSSILFNERACASCEPPCARPGRFAGRLALGPCPPAHCGARPPFPVRRQQPRAWRPSKE